MQYNVLRKLDDVHFLNVTQKKNIKYYCNRVIYKILCLLHTNRDLQYKYLRKMFYNCTTDLECDKKDICIYFKKYKELDNLYIKEMTETKEKFKSLKEKVLLELDYIRNELKKDDITKEKICDNITDILIKLKDKTI